MISSKEGRKKLPPDEMPDGSCFFIDTLIGVDVVHIERLLLNDLC